MTSTSNIDLSCARVAASAAFIACLVTGCGTSDGSEATERHERAPADANAEAESSGGTTRPGFCDRPGDDAVRDALCVETLPAIESLHDLQEVLDADPTQMGTDELFAGTPLLQNAFAASRAVNVLGHSTALSGQLVSPINPRAIILGTSVFLTFQRGVQRVELAALGRDTNLFNFYLVTFKQACNAEKRGCSSGDLYTPRVESDWLGVNVRDAEELKNTPLDCRQCHLRKRDEPVLLMRELESPWTHFFVPLEATSPFPGVGGADLMRDFLNAKGDEPYAGFAVDTISPLAPFTLQTFVSPQQPLLFDAPQIENERYPWGPDGYATEVHPSPTWDNAYEAFKRGEQLALPYVEPRATDPQKQAELTDAYQRYRAGELSADDLPNLADIFPDDPNERAKIGLQTQPDATPAEALIQACGPCHNDVLDQDISRARFNIDLARLADSEIALAVERIERPRTAAGAMPPPEARELDPEARARLLHYLRRNERSTDDDAQLARAAELGMAGGAKEQRRTMRPVNYSEN